jgi:hypothetical protein
VEEVADELGMPTTRAVTHTNVIAKAFAIEGYDELVAIARSLFPPVRQEDPTTEVTAE